MPVINVDKSEITSTIGGSKTPISWILEATQFINALNQFGTTISSIIAKFQSNLQNQVITSGSNAKITKSAPTQAQTSAGQSDQDLQKFFSTPEGMKKIVEAIDQLTPLIGDVKLSEVKQLINTAVGDKKQEEKKK